MFQVHRRLQIPKSSLDSLSHRLRTYRSLLESVQSHCWKKTSDREAYSTY